MSTTRRAWTYLLLMALAGCGTPQHSTVRVIIPRHASFRSATDSLANAGILRFPGIFRVYTRLRSRDRDIQAGTYLLRPGISWNDLINALNGGEGSVGRITIPEGFSVAQIAPVLALTLQVPAESVDVAVRDSMLLGRLGVPGPTLEGYLFPDTYVFPPGTSARQAVNEMVMRFEREWKPEYAGRLAMLGVSRHEAVTMASIVEKEAKLPEERAVIAAVYYNRLQKRMPLQADPTVQYALGHHVDRVLYKDLRIESPYNTYLHIGLPPGPIASPGGASLRAAVNPARVPYLYFVAASDGHHEFRTTLEEHDQARQAVRTGQR